MYLLPDSDLLIAGHNYEGIHVLNWKDKEGNILAASNEGSHF